MGRKNRISHRKIAILNSAESGDLTTLKRLYESSPSLHNTIYLGRTPLLICAHHGYLDCLEFIYSKHPESISVPTSNGCTPLYASAHRGHLDCLEFIYSKCPHSISIPNNSRCTPMYASASMGHLPCIKFILDKCPKSILTPRQDGSTPMCASVYNNHLHCIKFIYEECPHLLSDPRLLSICSDVNTFKYIDEAYPHLINLLYLFPSDDNRGLHLPNNKEYVDMKYPQMKFKHCPCCRTQTKYYRGYNLTLPSCPICLEPSSTPYFGLCGHGICSGCLELI